MGLQILNGLIFITAIIGAFTFPYITVFCGLIAFIIMYIKDIEGIKLIPLKGFAIWIFAFMLAKIISYYIKDINIVQYIPVFNLDVLTVLIVIGTNLLTNTAITVLGMPIVLKVFNTMDINYISMWFLTVSGLSFILPVANGCLAVTVGMGVPIKKMMKVGSIIVFLHLIVFLFLF